MQNEISDVEVAKIRERYEQKRLVCWFCRKEIPFDQLDPIHPVEDNPKFAAYGYGYCKRCPDRLRTALGRAGYGTKRN